MNETEIKITEAIIVLTKLLVPLATTCDEEHDTKKAIDALNGALIHAVGSRVIKGAK